MSSSAKRALRILSLLGRADRPLGVTEIARELALPPGTVFRSLDALSRADLISHYRSSSRYMLGPAAERLRRNLIARFRLREVCLPYLRQLASMSGETASLHVRLGWYAVRICSAPGTAEVMNSPPLGEAHVLGKTYAGKAILAFLPKVEIALYRAWMAKHFGPADKAVALREIVANGYACGEPDTAHAGPIAFPIRAGDRALAALAVEGPVAMRAGLKASGLSAWREIVANIEAHARTQPALFENPLGHIGADSILL